MTVCAFDVFKIVISVKTVSFRNFLVAFNAGYIFVSSIQLEPGFVMNEFFRFPVIEAMAFQAVGLVILPKLSMMNISVAILTIDIFE